ncbi:MAG: signal peptide peptidase SppA [Anaerolineales bacterium]
MLAYPAYALRYLFRVLGNLIRRIGKAPEYVTFKLEGAYPEYPRPAGNFIQRRLTPRRTSLLELGERFRTVAGDPRVKGVVLHLRALSMPQSQLETLRDMLQELRAAGKHIVVWTTTLDTARYYVASAADEILLQPGGSVLPFGMTRRYLFLADSLDRAGLQGDFVPISPYKSAGDMFRRSDMSEEVREMAGWLLDSAFDEFVQAIAAGRHVDTQTARALIDQTPCSDLQAIDLGLVDKLIHEEALPEHLQRGDKPARIIPWKQAAGRLRRPPLQRPGRYVALLTVEGLIIDGESARPPIRPPLPIPLLFDKRAGDLSVVQAARKVAADKRAAAAVLFVDSPGGSATASEAMAAALQRIAARKPLVVVMGAVAASGGYYVSTPGQYIFAQPSTITGSIGVIIGKIVNAGLLDRLLFNRENLSRGEHVRMFDSEAQFSEAERELVWDSIQRIYDVFVGRVADSRRMDPEAVDAIGGGRVWTGRQALENGLVDEIGGLGRALARARELAGLHKRARVRLVTPGKQPVPPAANPAAAFTYALEGVRALQGGAALCLSPIARSED